LQRALKNKFSGSCHKSPFKIVLYIRRFDRPQTIKDGGFMSVFFRKKNILSLLLALAIILTVSSAAYAAPTAMSIETGSQMRWNYTTAVTVRLSINNGLATLTASINGYEGVTKITAKAILERQNSDGTYTELASWNNISADGRYLDWSTERYVSSGYTYRFTINATVYKDSIGENVSGSKSMSY
jgi:hypothetical protein